MDGAGFEAAVTPVINCTTFTKRAWLSMKPCVTLFARQHRGRATAPPASEGKLRSGGGKRAALREPGTGIYSRSGIR